ncbi:MAG: quinolinate synthase NadA [Bdellovibrionales bacterium]|nr:quinolinate synthase NadA [Bdellovibrionales bacterium]
MDPTQTFETGAQPLGTAQPSDVVEAIARLKREKNAVIMAHYYQESAIQDIADYIGDSLGLAQEGAKTDADIIVLAGVLFMGETAKILNPEKTVLVPDLAAGCSLADNCPADEFQRFIARYPDHTVVTYVNCSAEVKGLSDILCTSSNAVKIIHSIPTDRPILFAPDQHLGRYLMRVTGRDMVLWEGACMVHESFDARNIVRLKARHPDALVIAHPECPTAVLDLADHVGSTSSLLSFAKTSGARKFIVVTESGIIHQMQKACPEKQFIAAPNNESCNCAECPYMRLNTLQKIYQCLLHEEPAVELAPEVIAKALLPLERMLELSK